MDLSVHLIIDGNFILYKNVFVLHKTKTLYTDLRLALEFNIKRLINLGQWDQKWMVIDSKNSWRKNLYPEYKGNRNNDDTIDWEWVWNLFEEFTSTIKGINIIKEENLEGDDCIAILCKEINDIGGSIVIASDDKDFSQLIRYKNNSINFLYSDVAGREKLTVPLDTITILNIMKNSNRNIFSGDDWESTKRVYDTLYRLYYKIKHDEIDWKEKIIRKIVEGDRGDNIKSVWEEKQQLKEGGERFVGIGKANSLKIYNLYLEKGGETFKPYSNESLNLLVSCIKEVKGIEDDINIIDKTNLNRKLMVLDLEYLPSEPSNKLSKKVKELIRF